MTALLAQKAITGFAALALASTGAAFPGSNAEAAPLIFDCYSRSSSDLLMKSALDLSSANLACVQSGGAMPIAYQPVITQPIVVTPAPAPAPSAGGSFIGSVIGGALGGVIGNAIHSGNRVEHHHHYNKKNGNNQPNTQPSDPGQVHPGLLLLKKDWQSAANQGLVNMVEQQKLQQQKMRDAMVRISQVQQMEQAKKNICKANPFISCRGK